MDIRTLFLSHLCCAALGTAGCTSAVPDAAPVGTLVLKTTPSVVPTPMNAMGYVGDGKCVPAVP